MNSFMSLVAMLSIFFLYIACVLFSYDAVFVVVVLVHIIESISCIVVDHSHDNRQKTLNLKIK